MTQLGKKIRERWFLDAFIRQNSLALHVMAEREQPDFECEFEGRIIGLEVTELFHPVNGSALQKRFVTSRKIVRDAYRLYIDFKLPPVQVTVLFSPGHSLQLVHRISLSQRLAELIAQSYPSETPLRLETSKVAPDLYPAVLTVFIRAIPYESMAHWDVGRAGWVARLNNDALEPVISAKEVLLPLYQASYSENWLLIAAEHGNPAQMFETSADFDVHSVRSSFTRTYFFNFFESKALASTPSIC